MGKRAKRGPAPDRKPGAHVVLLGGHNNFYGAQIREAKIGPRRELTLLLETWPKNSFSFGGRDLVTLRFGALFNFEEVQKFFARPINESLHYLRYARESNRRRHVIEMEFD
jgi:hypothetical protein